MNELEEQVYLAENYINNKFNENLPNQKIKSLEQTDKLDNGIRVFHLSKIIYDKKENSHKKLRTVLNSVRIFCGSLGLVVKCESRTVDLYMVVKSKTDIKTASSILVDSFNGNFPGSEIARENTVCLDEIMKGDCVATLNFIPSVSDIDEEKLVGLEKFVDTMINCNYTCFILAKPLSNDDFKNRLNGLEELYSALSPLEKTTLSNGTNEGKSFTESIANSLSESITNGINTANTASTSTSNSKQSGTNVGMHLLFNVGVSNGTSITASNSNSITNGSQESETVNKGSTMSTSKTQSESISINTTKEYKNKRISNMLSTIELHIDRIIKSQGNGLWESGIYFIGHDKKTVSMGASTFVSSLSDDNSRIEKTNINVFGTENTNTKELLSYLRYLQHPIFHVRNQNNIIVKPVNYIDGKELSELFNLPRKSVPGVIVDSKSEFGRNIKVKENDDTIDVGSIFHMGKVDSSRVKLNLNTMTSHCFITGSTGSGKSNTVYKLIEEISLKNYSIPFLVIEPAKGEYRNQFRKVPNINLFTTNLQLDQMLKINPFSFNSNIHILEHLDRLVEIFNACWEMYAAMPAILKEAIETAYINKGWDLLNSIYMNEGEPVFPTFADVLYELPRIINSSQYSADTKGDYIGALVTRVNSMTNGIYGQIFCDDIEVDDRMLFDENTVIDLSRIGSSETKSLIMGILILKLTEYRMSKSRKGNQNLNHITILEEAHNILKNTDKMSGTAGNTVVSKSVEMIVNSIAEMRTYGEGFIIVDQSPTSIDIAAIKNTNTKFVMRLPDKDDCEIAGHSLALSNEQTDEISKLGTGETIIMQNNWDQAILSKIDVANNIYYNPGEKVSIDSIRQFNNIVLKELINQYIISDKPDLEKIKSRIENFEISNSKKEEMKRRIDSFANAVSINFNSKLLGKTIIRLSGCSYALKNAENRLQKNVETKEYTDDSVIEWYWRIHDILAEYNGLEENEINLARQYIIHAKKYEQSLINYGSLYRKIYM